MGEPASRSKIKDPTTFGDLIDLHVTDMKEVLRAPRRSKAFTLDALKTKLGKSKLKDLTRERLIQFGKDRAKEGAGPVTISMDIGYIKLVVSHAAAVHGVRVQVEPIDLARIALKRLGWSARAGSGDRRPICLQRFGCLTRRNERRGLQHQQLHSAPIYRPPNEFESQLAQFFTQPDSIDASTRRSA